MILKGKIIWVLSFFALLSTGLTKSVYAQAGRALTIIPPKFELFSQPGSTEVETIKVKNESDVPVTYSIVIEDFTTSGEEGQVVLEEGETDSSYSLAQWIEMETKDLILQPNEEKTIAFMINVPRNAEPGGHYASVLFQSQTQSVPGNAAVASRVGSLILLRVSGNINENAQLETFTMGSNYVETGPVTFTMRVKNEGNVHINPQGKIVITNLFNQVVSEVPLESRNVLPGAVRKVDTVWPEKNLFGRYKATLIATYGEGAEKKLLTSAVVFTAASKTAILLIVVSIVAVVGLLITLVAGRKRMGKALKMMATGK